MFDFTLTEAGDLEYENKAPFAPMHVTFTVAEYPSQHISFLSVPKPIIRPKKNGQHITFRFMPKIQESQLKDVPVQDTAEIVQAMNIEFRTELGDTLNEEIGSNFYRHIHDVVKGEEDMEKIRLAAQNIVNKYFKDAEVDASYEIHEDAGNFAFQAVVIRIYDSDEALIASYIF